MSERPQRIHLSTTELDLERSRVRADGGRMLAVLPIGCTEQHGPHLPLETDSIIAEGIARALCARLNCTNGIGAHVVPAVCYSPTRSNMTYPGTVSMPEDIFRGYVRALGEQLLATYDGVVFVSGHGPADAFLKEIAFVENHSQFGCENPVVQPYLVLSVADISGSLAKHFGQSAGRHADWREFVLLYRILGSDQFDSDAVKRIREFASFDVVQPGLLGVPLEHRSVQGVIGPAYPDTEDLDVFSLEVWEYLVSHFERKVLSDLADLARIEEQRSAST